MANLLVEEPDALMCARPDLWERWVSNHPTPPGPPARNGFVKAQRGKRPIAITKSQKRSQTDDIRGLLAAYIGDQLRPDLCCPARR